MATASRAFNGKRLRALRTEKGWSQGELGRRIGAHTTSVSDWERGDNAPSGRHVAGLAREFGIEAEHFYDSDDDSEAALSASGDLSRDEYALYGALTARIVRGAARIPSRLFEESGSAVPTLVVWAVAFLILATGWTAA